MNANQIELFSFHSQIVISRSLYKILIENAFNPQRRRADEIEEYLEKLLQSYENELMNFKTRTKVQSENNFLPFLLRTFSFRTLVRVDIEIAEFLRRFRRFESIVVLERIKLFQNLKFFCSIK